MQGAKNHVQTSDIKIQGNMYFNRQQLDDNVAMQTEWH